MSVHERLSGTELKRILADARKLDEYFAEHDEFPPQERWWYVVSLYSGPTAQNTLWKLESRRQRTEFKAHDMKDTLIELNPTATYFVISLTYEEAKILHGDN